ncbi:MAG: metallophosphoesterase [Magnetospiraceae bacterium]
MSEISEAEVSLETFARQRLKRSQRFAFKAFRIFLVGHLYVGWRLLFDLPGPWGWSVAGAAVLAATALLIPFGTFSRVFVADPKLVDRLVWAGGIAMGWFSSLLILTILRDVAFLLPATRDYAAQSALLVITLSLLVTVIGFANARRVAKVVRVSIPLQNLPAALEGFTIAQISDLHVGPTIKRPYVQRVVDRVNSLAPDMVALTGDIVDGKVSSLAEDVAPLEELSAAHGAYLVTGNHEYYHGVDAWIPEFERLGIQVLGNRHVLIAREDAQIAVAGIHDFSANRSSHPHVSDAAAALAEAPMNTPKIMLAHQPRSAPAVAAAGADLQLSGHTHGGQIWPWNYLVRFQQPFTAGLHREAGMWVYISRGTGYWGPPKRLGAPSEITLITLTRAS